MSKQGQSNMSYPMLNVVTSDEITSIDKRITSCIIENPDEDNNEYYVKIWFTYKDRLGTKPDGRHEFITNTKEKLIEAIKDFFLSEKDGYRIILSS